MTTKQLQASKLVDQRLKEAAGGFVGPARVPAEPADNAAFDAAKKIVAKLGLPPFDSNSDQSEFLTAVEQAIGYDVEAIASEAGCEEDAMGVPENIDHMLWEMIAAAALDDRKAWDQAITDNQVDCSGSIDGIICDLFINASSGGEKDTGDRQQQGGISGRVEHSEFGTGTVVKCQPADEDDRQYYVGDLEFSVGMTLCSVDWDDGGTTETLVAADELTAAD